MTKVKEKILKEIDVLNESDLLYLFDYISRLKIPQQNISIEKKFNNEEIKTILNKISGNLSDDIKLLREDRI